MSQNPIKTVHLEEKKFVGFPVTSSFSFHEPKRIEEAKREFLDRKHEIRNVVNPDEYVCPHFASEVLFTYFFCMEVSELEEIPEGMIGFTIPARNYVTTRSDADPYEVLHTYIKDNGIDHNPKALALEIYQFADPNWPGKVDVFVPIKEI
jgi:predicted transcriptional regulator YdeE